MHSEELPTSAEFYLDQVIKDNLVKTVPGTFYVGFTCTETTGKAACTKNRAICSKSQSDRDLRISEV